MYSLFKQQFKFSRKTINKITELVEEYHDDIRYTQLKGHTYSEYYNIEYFKVAALPKKPKKTDLKSYLEELPFEGRKLLVRVILEDYKCSEETKDEDIDKLYNRIIERTNNSLFHIFDYETIDEMMDYEDDVIPEFINCDFFLEGYFYAYEDDGILCLSIPDEIKDIIYEKMSLQDETLKLSELIAKYLLLNGVLELDKLETIMKHHTTINREKLMELLKPMDTHLYEDNIITYIPNMSPEIIEELLRIKNAFGDYRILNKEDKEYEKEFVGSMLDIMFNLDDATTATILKGIITMVFQGYYDKSSLESILEKENALNLLNRLDKIINDYKTKVGIWILNGYSLDDKKV